MSDCHSLWQELRQLSRKMGDSFCYIYGTAIVIWFIVLTLGLYGGLIGIFNHGIQPKGITLLVNTLACTSVLFVISDAGQRVCQEVSNVIVRLYVCRNVSTVIDSFHQLSEKKTGFLYVSV